MNRDIPNCIQAIWRRIVLEAFARDCGDIPAGLILDNHRVSLVLSATLVLRVCDSSALSSPTPILATTQVVDANGLRSSRRSVPRSVRTACGVGSQPSLRRGTSGLQGKHLFSVPTAQTVFSSHENAWRYAGPHLWTAVRCRRGKRMFCAALELDSRNLAFWPAPHCDFGWFVCRRCFLRRFSSRWKNSVAKRGKRRRKRRQRKLERRTRSLTKPHQRLRRARKAQRFARAGRVCD